MYIKDEICVNEQKKYIYIHIHVCVCICVCVCVYIIYIYKKETAEAAIIKHKERLKFWFPLTSAI